MLEIYKCTDNPNMFVVTGRLYRDPVIVAYADSRNVRVYDNQHDLGKSLGPLKKRLQETNALTFLAVVGEDVEAFYNRLLDNPLGGLR